MTARGRCLQQGVSCLSVVVVVVVVLVVLVVYYNNEHEELIGYPQSKRAQATLGAIAAACWPTLTRGHTGSGQARGREG